MQCQSEEDCARVAKCLPSTEAALLDWAVNLMADVVQEELLNKMNAHNIAMVFAPNMTQVIHCPDSIADWQYPLMPNVRISRQMITVAHL
jgi:hypothetical protein